MIGQKAVKSEVKKWKQLPKFMIIEGEVGSGRKTLIRYIANSFEADSVLVGNSVEDVRNIIADANTLFRDRIYVLDGNSLSNASLNALLKITEEPPLNCHIAMTVDSINSALPTLASRAKVVTMLPYTIDEKLEYLKNSKVENFDEVDSRILVDYCHLASNLSMIDEIVKAGAEEVFNKVSTFYELIWEASESNALKVTQWLKFKESDEGKIEPKLFLNCLLNWSSVILFREGASMSFDEVRQHDALVRFASTCLKNVKRRGSNARVYVNEFLRKVKTFE